MPYTPARAVGTMPMAAHAAIFFMSSFWRMLTRVRFASRMLVSISLKAPTCSSTRRRWSSTSRK